MRESSHFDGHQTTGYNLPKNITGRYASHRIAFPGRYWGDPHKRQYVDRLSIRGGAGFLGAGRSSPELLPRQRFDSAAQLARTASKQGKMLTERGAAPPFHRNGVAAPMK
ncbi:hypothetical protein N2603_39390 [Bradyrhizobium huanghuaihaiense]|uniref:hypothetical protein n=1 Tax=Bradyrhizobium huanghuaihaiense TaxID=990078 RepID=UPI0021AA4362|nr:hypothetical protein [Bradyrhizobium sp. CB3035]UWU75940.1 hypothetical protein N2603_39390 [Bradyrhizobium sp. CB3035]